MKVRRKKRYIFVQIFLLLLGFSLIGFMVAYPYIAERSELAMQFLQNPKLKIGGVLIEGATITGKDNKNQPYIVNAATIKKDENDDNITYLTLPKGNILVNEKHTKYNVSAKSGKVNDRDKILTLNDGVIIDNDTTNIKTDNIQVYYQRKELNGDDPVVGVIERVRFWADGLKITNNGQLVSLKGKSKLVVR